MKSLPKNVLLTGPPGCGKTTVIRRIVERLRDLRMAGFYTQEIRQQRQRMGFEAIGLSGVRATLAHVDFCTQHRLGRYGLDLGGFRTILRAELAKPADQVDLYIIDEIGKMECLSPVFAKIVSRILDGPVPVLATIAAKGSGFIGQVKVRPDVEILTVTAESRDTQRYGRTEIGGYDPAHVHVDRLIAQVAEAYPRARILVIATRQNDVLFLYQRLTERGLRLRRCFWREQFGSWGRGIRRLVLRLSF